jgi:hypothetical protein
LSPWQLLEAYAELLGCCANEDTLAWILRWYTTVSGGMVGGASLARVKVTILKQVERFVGRSRTCDPVVKRQALAERTDFEGFLQVLRRHRRRGAQVCIEPTPLTAAIKDFHVNVCTDMPASLAKTLLILGGLVQWHKRPRPGMRCLNKIFHVAGRMGDVCHQSSMNRIAHGEGKCTCMCACETCWHTLCFYYRHVGADELSHLRAFFKMPKMPIVSVADTTVPKRPAGKTARNVSR